MKYMLDTNICIYVIKEKQFSVLSKFRKCNPGDIGISSITLMELEYGVEKSEYKERNRLALAGFLVPIEILPFSVNAAREYGKIRSKLEKQGNIIGAYDLMIGAHAISEKLTLVTNNLREFEGIPELTCENWVIETDNKTPERY